ncbi:MAG: winged helix-turn-helix domain-containing protein [Candidatus Methanoperedens sp.]|nr:winged helix-turn-helix domain-containing protein [Candidatus Methanoperedens sp.]
MKSRGLLSVLTYSEKREDILFLLLKEPRTLTELKDHFNITSPEILPRIKELVMKNLIYKQNGKYVLTPIGKVIGKFYQQFIETLYVIERNEEFWKGDVVDEIPPLFLERISELGNCKLLENRLENIYEPHADFSEKILKSKYVKEIAPILHPKCPLLFLDIAQPEKSISLIVTKNVLERLKKEHNETVKKSLSKNTNLFLLNHEIKLALIVSDMFLSLSLFSRNGPSYSQRNLISFDKSAVKWGEELFMYYRGLSEEIRSV